MGSQIYSQFFFLGRGVQEENSLEVEKILSNCKDQHYLMVQNL